MPATCQEVISPEFLKDYKPDLIILMNPIYFDEVKSEIDKWGLTPNILALGCDLQYDGDSGNI